MKPLLLLVPLLFLLLIVAVAVADMPESITPYGEGYHMTDGVIYGGLDNVSIPQYRPGWNNLLNSWYCYPWQGNFTQFYSNESRVGVTLPLVGFCPIPIMIGPVPVYIEQDTSKAANVYYNNMGMAFQYSDASFWSGYVDRGLHMDPPIILATDCNTTSSHYDLPDNTYFLVPCVNVTSYGSNITLQVTMADHQSFTFHYHDYQTREYPQWYQQIFGTGEKLWDSRMMWLDEQQSFVQEFNQWGGSPVWMALFGAPSTETLSLPFYGAAYKELMLNPMYSNDGEKWSYYLMMSEFDSANGPMAYLGGYEGAFDISHFQITSVTVTSDVAVNVTYLSIPEQWMYVDRGTETGGSILGSMQTFIQFSESMIMTMWVLVSVVMWFLSWFAGNFIMIFGVVEAVIFYESSCRSNPIAGFRYFLRTNNKAVFGTFALMNTMITMMVLVARALIELTQLAVSAVTGLAGAIASAFGGLVGAGAIGSLGSTIATAISQLFKRGNI